MLTIRKIQIYGFGKHDNITISLSDDITIFYGMNEAGKTTIQQFILQLLFGFPTKQQTQRKYEPKTSTRFGGQLTIWHPIYGQCTIERVKGRAAGDVTIYLEDGTVGQDELLAKLLYGYSRASFESIFSFSIHELQGIEKMSEEELTHLLIASGTTGVQQLSTIERKVEKEAGDLFKKSGKIPIINQKLEHLKQLERTIKQEQSNIQSFEDKLLQLKQLDQKLEDLYKQQKLQQQNWQQLNILKQAMPLMKQQKALEQTLKIYEHVQFPPEGIRRYEQLKDRLMHETLQLQQQKEQAQELQRKLSLTIDEQAIHEMSRLLNKEATWNQLIVKEQNLMDNLYLLEQEIEAQFRLLGVQENEAQLNLLEETVSLQQEEQFQRQLSLLEKAEEELKFHLRSLEQIHIELDSIAQHKQRLQQEALTAEEEHILAQWPQRKRKLEQLRHVRSQRSKQKQSSALIWILLAISICSIIYGVFGKNMAVIVLGAAIVLFLILYLKFSRDENKASEQPNQLIRELEQEENIAQAILLKKQRQEERLLQIHEQQQEKERQYVQLEYKIQQAERVSEEATQSLQQFLGRFHLEGNIARTLLPELFMRIRGAQELEAKRKSTSNLLQTIQVEKHELYEQLKQVLKAEYSEQEIFMHLRTTFLTIQQEQKMTQHTKEQLTNLTINIQGIQSHIENVESQIAQLFSAANVQLDKEYYEIHEQFEQQQKFKAELLTIKSQLASLDIPNDESMMHDSQLSERLNTLETEQEASQLAIDHCLEQRATLHVQKEQLLNDEKYGQLLQHFEQEKSILQQLIGQWATKRALSNAIHETLFSLREEKLPYVLTEVNAIFCLLTGERYTKLFINDAGYFVAQDAASGLHYHMAELSQATKEQAYISLRMALAKTLSTSAPFPFIMDDPFVHFDRIRTDKMVQLMKEVGYERQVLYFTCHDTMLKYWRKDQIVDISALANERGVAST